MKRVDLHVHSNASDGTFSPTVVVQQAADAGLAAMALTDHDSVRGVEEALLAAERLRQEGRDIRVIPGIELSVEHRRGDIHILGLFVDIHHEVFLKETMEAVAGRERRNEQMVQNLADAGIAITMQDLKEGNPDTVVTRAHFSRYLVKAGYAGNMNEAFAKYLNPDTPYYVPRAYVTKKRGIELIRMAGGIPVLAHPLNYKLEIKELENLVAELKSYGLAGIEALYSSHCEADESYVRRLAKQNRLLLSGGSDYHGTNKPDIHIGTGRGNLEIPYEFVEKMEDWLKSRKTN